MAEVWRKVKVPCAGIVGAGLGAATGELLSETVARAAALKDWYRVGAKGGIKLGVALLGYGVSTRVPGLWSLFAEIFGYSAFGSWFADWFYQLYPGGIWGMAESMAVSLRTWAVGAEKVKAEIEALEAGLEEKAGARPEEVSAIL